LLFRTATILRPRITDLRSILRALTRRNGHVVLYDAGLYAGVTCSRRCGAASDRPLPAYYQHSVLLRILPLHPGSTPPNDTPDWRVLDGNDIACDTRVDCHHVYTTARVSPDALEVHRAVVNIDDMDAHLPFHVL